MSEDKKGACFVAYCFPNGYLINADLIVRRLYAYSHFKYVYQFWAGGDLVIALPIEDEEAFWCLTIGRPEMFGNHPMVSYALQKDLFWLDAFFSLRTQSIEEAVAFCKKHQPNGYQRVRLVPEGKTWEELNIRPVSQ